MNWWRRLVVHYRAHKVQLTTVGVVLSFVVATLFGQGLIFQWQSWKAEHEKADEDRVELEANLVEKLSDYKTRIFKLTPEYVSKRDLLPNNPTPDQQTAYNAVMFQLTTLFLSYNELEAKLSKLEDRGPQFLLPQEVIRPRPPKIVSMSPVGGRVLVHLELQKDDVTEDVSEHLALIFDQNDKSFRAAYYLTSCKLGQAAACTSLATLRMKSRLWQHMYAKDRELYERGCSLGDGGGCEFLGFYEFNQRRFKSSKKWLTKACALRVADGCGFLGTLDASTLLGTGRNLPEGRAELEQGCEIGSARSCYYLAILLVSGLVERDLAGARNRLELSCGYGLHDACEALKKFNAFQACSPDAMPALKGDVAIYIECKQPLAPEARHNATRAEH